LGSQNFQLFGGILISPSSNSWLGAWIGLEINLMSFIPLILSQENVYTTEASLKCILVQALASSFLLMQLRSYLEDILADPV
jgi:NADH-ubiquinone oxidoreductase chain 2